MKCIKCICALTHRYVDVWAMITKSPATHKWRQAYKTNPLPHTLALLSLDHSHSLLKMIYASRNDLSNQHLPGNQAEQKHFWCLVTSLNKEDSERFYGMFLFMETAKDAWMRSLITLPYLYIFSSNRSRERSVKAYNFIVKNTSSQPNVLCTRDIKHK